MIGLISLRNIMEQFLAILTILHLFQHSEYSPIHFLDIPSFSEDAEETICFNRFNHTKLIFSTV